MYKQFVQKFGKPSQKTVKIFKSGKTKPVKFTWTNVNGLDGIELHKNKKYKWHPYPAPVFVYAYKYLKVPELLIGPLKYASETIKIDEIDIPYEYSKLYHTTGKKRIAKVTGSCASVVISAITIKFVQDMCKKHKNAKLKELPKLYTHFRKIYDDRIKTYIDTRNITPKIPWLIHNDI